ncbi:MAG: hypothetical protein BWY91_03342 [bacterium ADurb.BinA028]|nr:MAG: hypothetical protein BWY91_03342 [bacterium ADurb.BinA028]
MVSIIRSAAASYCIDALPTKASESPEVLMPPPSVGTASADRSAERAFTSRALRIVKPLALVTLPVGLFSTPSVSGARPSGVPAYVAPSLGSVSRSVMVPVVTSAPVGTATDIA